MDAYAIKDWIKWYEKSHKDTERTFSWVAVPTRHDGKSYRRLTRQKKWMEIFAAFILMLEVAAKMPRRGVLADEGGPLDEQDLADSTGGDATVFKRALSILSDARVKICWIERVPVVATSRDFSGESRATEQDSTEHKEKTVSPNGDADSGGVAAEKQPPGPTLESADPPGFATFWTEYPSAKAFPKMGTRKKGRAKCLRIWKREQLERIAEMVIASLRRCKASHDWRKEQGEFIPMPGSWLGDTPWLTDAAEQPAHDPDASKRVAAEEGRRNAAVAEADRQQQERDRAERVRVLSKLPADELAMLKRECVDAATPDRREKMEAADPLSGQGLSILMYSRLKLREIQRAEAS